MVVVVVVMCPFSPRVSLVVALSLKCLRSGVELEERRGWEAQCVLCIIKLSSSRLQKCRSCFVANARRLDRRSFSHVRHLDENAMHLLSLSGSFLGVWLRGHAHGRRRCRKGSSMHSIKHSHV